jgi:hypothetical protein
MILKLKFKFEKETPGTVRYQEVGADGNPASAPSVPMLYVRKSAMPDGKSRSTSPPSSCSRNPRGHAVTGKATLSMSLNAS